MITLTLTGICFGLGVWFVLRGFMPSRPTLSERLKVAALVDDTSAAERPRAALRSFWGRVAVNLLDRVRSDSLDELDADLFVSNLDRESHAIEKLNAAIGAGMLLSVIARIVGWADGPLEMSFAFLLGGGIGFLFPDIELRRQAATRREEFAEALNAFVSLVAVSMAGGGGVTSAMRDATSLGGGWPFEMLRQALDEAFIFGESPWSAFDRLGRRADVVQLIELAGALSLAGSSGAKVGETLRSRAETGREKAMAELKAEAERKSESMNLPVGAMLLGWVVFMGYPAIATLLGN